jgi:Ser/Thr protein kinase RdoA (MazF antagonist)
MNDIQPARTHFPVTHSILSTAALLALVLPDYQIGAPIDCKLLGCGLNDTYLVKTTDAQFILRAYRATWRSVAEIHYELDVLNHLDRSGVAVAVPIARKDGGFISDLHAPEGTRRVALFRYAPGQELTHDQEQSYQYGQAAAAIHTATDGFTSIHQRARIDLSHLIDQPLAAIQPFLEHRPEDWEYLQQIAAIVREHIAGLPVEQLDSGFCHGDFHGGNAHIDAQKQITFFDFDCSGPGWRAYDIAVFRWGRGRQVGTWEAFLKGYTERRPLNDLDLAAVPWFVAARHIWLLGLHTANSQDWGSGWINDAYFDNGGAGGLEFLREWDSEHLQGPQPG